MTAPTATTTTAAATAVATSDQSGTLWIFALFDGLYVPPLIDTVVSTDFDNGLQEVARVAEQFYKRENLRFQEKEKIIEWKAVKKLLKDKSTTFSNETLEDFYVQVHKKALPMRCNIHLQPAKCARNE